MTVQIDQFSYDDAIVRKFTLMTFIWGVVGMLVGVIVALQLAAPVFNFELPWLSFGRLRPLHTNAVIFAFAGNAVFAGIYYSMQRLLKTTMFSKALGAIHFWGWQAIIVAAAVTLPLGITQGKEYAELQWPIDIAIAVIWVVFAINAFATIAIRRERHIYVAIWFYIATIVTIALLHIFNNLVVPAGLWRSYPIYAGVQDAFMQWWYGHNAVGFLLTTPFLGLMYYFLPKAANRPVFSYRLSIIHFWSLVFLYIWAGPHHLHYTALPAWASTLGMLFSVMLWMPSWGGMLNGLLTLRGAWDKVASDPVLKFFVVAITFYGMSTFEGPLLSVKMVNLLSHYTDWTIAHVHAGALGWVGFLTFGMIYWLLPRLFQAELWSRKLAEAHFWLGTIGILLYVVAIYAAGLTQGLMWLAFDDEGYLKYGDFVETTLRLIPMYWVRVIGGLAYLAGALMLGVNFFMTWKSRGAADLAREERRPCRQRGLQARPLLLHHLAPPLGKTAAQVHRRGGYHGRGGFPLRDHSDLPHQVQRSDDRDRDALHTSRARRTRHLPRRGLLQLPLADDPPDSCRDRALWRVLQTGRVRVGPPLPMGLPAHRPRSAEGRRQVPRSVARSSHGRSTCDHRRFDHARLPVDAEHSDRFRFDRKGDASAPYARRALQRRRGCVRRKLGARASTGDCRRDRRPGRS
jgi:cytochrome c oxidase cbb3-type subunit I/II